METVCIFKCGQCLQEILVRGNSSPNQCLHPHLSLISYPAPLRRFSQPQGTCNSTKRTRYDPHNIPDSKKQKTDVPSQQTKGKNERAPCKYSNTQRQLGSSCLGTGPVSRASQESIGGCQAPASRCPSPVVGDKVRDLGSARRAIKGSK